MRRVATLGLAVLVLAAGGCGQSPEDKARDAGAAIGGDVYTALNAKRPQEAGAALAAAATQVRDLKDDLPSSASAQLSAILAQLTSSVRAAQDPAAVRQAGLEARSQLDTLASDSDSVVNEFRRGVRQGYQDAAG